MNDKLRLKVKELELEEAKARIIRLEQLLKDMTASRDWEYEDGLRNLHIRSEQHELILDLMKRLEATSHNSQPDDTPDWLNKKPKRLLEEAYMAGFNASGEGYNGEYPFRDKGQWPDDNADWCQERDEKLKELLEETNG